MRSTPTNSRETQALPTLLTLTGAQARGKASAQAAAKQSASPQATRSGNRSADLQLNHAKAEVTPIGATTVATVGWRSLRANPQHSATMAFARGNRPASFVQAALVAESRGFWRSVERVGEVRA